MVCRELPLFPLRPESFMPPKILTVDDSKTIRMLLARLFGKYHCEIFEAENGSEGLNVASTEKPDLIIIDYNMPVMDGITMLRQLRENEELKKTPVIMLTGDTSLEILTSVSLLGLSECVSKPFIDGQLLAKVSRFLSIESRDSESGPGISNIQELLERIHGEYQGINDGELANYIPELGKANPDHFGICLASVEGTLFEAGDCNVEFSLQSTSKALVYARALTSHGRNLVTQRVGIEPSGDAFNSIQLDKLNRAFNPMVNAGAITTTGFIEGASLAERRETLLRTFSAAAGRQLRIDERIYQSESETGHRNRALAWLVTNFDKMDHATNMETLELYFMQCSILVTARDLAIMGATLANTGTNPFTGENVFDVGCTQDTLSVMFTCGMYDYAGEWAYRVGIPSKSGVGGGIMGVVNRQLGIGTFSPRLDERGNSVRGIRAYIHLSEELGLHAFNFMNDGSSYLRAMMIG